MKKKIGLIVVGVFLIAIQFISFPKNKSTEILATDITKVKDVPEGVLMILKTSCYDCHSNSTIYPWYNNIQPVEWWLNNHVREGKEHLNFSEFGKYDEKKAKKKLREIAKVLEKDEMPLISYTLIHRNAVLNLLQKQLVINWAKSEAITNTEN